MENKQKMIETIREWVKLDNEIRVLQKEEKIRTKEKKNLSKELIEIMRENEIDCVDLKDGHLTYSRKNVKKPITKKMLLEILSKYYDGDVEKAVRLNHFILENQEQTFREEIVRTVKKDTVDIKEKNSITH
jgi:hypothetical protein